MVFKTIKENVLTYQTISETKNDEICIINSALLKSIIITLDIKQRINTKLISGTINALNSIDNSEEFKKKSLVIGNVPTYADMNGATNLQTLCGKI